MLISLSSMNNGSSAVNVAKSAPNDHQLTHHIIHPNENNVHNHVHNYKTKVVNKVGDLLVNNNNLNYKVNVANRNHVNSTTTTNSTNNKVTLTPIKRSSPIPIIRPEDVQQQQQQQQSQQNQKNQLIINTQNEKHETKQRIDDISTAAAVVLPPSSPPQPLSLHGLEPERLTHHLAHRIEGVIREAKKTTLDCNEVLIPCQLTTNIGQDIITMAESEPCGLRGCILFINLEEKECCRRVGSFRLDQEGTVPTFEMYLTLRKDSPGGWLAAIGLRILKNLGGGREDSIVISDSYKLSKKKLYRNQ